MLESVEWCTLCSERPADGTLTIKIEEFIDDVPACTECVNDPDKVTFVEDGGKP